LARGNGRTEERGTEEVRRQVHCGAERDPYLSSDGTTPFSPAKLGAQLGLNLLQALLAALLLSMVPGLGSYGRRIGFFALLGLLMATATNVEYWNWYGFPTSYTLTAMCDKFIGFLVVGLAVGAVIKTDGKPDGGGIETLGRLVWPRGRSRNLKVKGE